MELPSISELRNPKKLRCDLVRTYLLLLVGCFIIHRVLSQILCTIHSVTKNSSTFCPSTLQYVPQLGRQSTPLIAFVFQNPCPSSYFPYESDLEYIPPESVLNLSESVQTDNRPGNQQLRSYVTTSRVEMLFGLRKPYM